MVENKILKNSWNLKNAKSLNEKNSKFEIELKRIENGSKKSLENSKRTEKGDRKYNFKRVMELRKGGKFNWRNFKTSNLVYENPNCFESWNWVWENPRWFKI